MSKKKRLLAWFLCFLIAIGSFPTSMVHAKNMDYENFGNIIENKDINSIPIFGTEEPSEILNQRNFKSEDQPIPFFNLKDWFKPQNGNPSAIDIKPTENISPMKNQVPFETTPSSETNNTITPVRDSNENSLWTLDDFNFSPTPDETTPFLNGFSQKGKEKAKTLQSLIFSEKLAQEIASKMNGKGVYSIGGFSGEHTIQGYVLQTVDFTNLFKVIGDKISLTPHAFQSSGVQNVIGLNFKEIPDYAFTGNSLSQIQFGDAVKTVGVEAFRDNKLTAVDTNQVSVIKDGAFSNNKMTSIVFHDPISEIGNKAFYNNDLSEVRIPNSITAFGKSVFAANNRYVRVLTENPLIKTEKTPGYYGHVVNAVRIVVKYVDEKGQTLLSDKILGDDLSKEGEIFVLGEETVFKPEKIQGYYIPDEVNFTPKADRDVLTLVYKSTKQAPKIVQKDIPMVKLNEVVDEAKLKTFVVATDLTGKDITNKVKVSPASLDTSSGGIKTVTYTVTDDFGNQTSLDVQIPVEIDWSNYPIGGGWVLGDFIFEDRSDGTSILKGFSTQGKEKVKTNKDLVLPGFSLTKKPVVGIDNYAFPSNQLTSLDLSDCTNLQSIGHSAFKSNQLTSLNLSGCTNLQSIEGSAFYNNKLTSLDLSDCTNLQSIGESAFSSNQLTSLDLSSCTNLQNIGESAFSSNKLTSLDLSGCTNLQSIGESAFGGNKLTSLDLSGCTNLQSIGESAFINSPGVKEYNNKVVITTTEEVARRVPSKENYIINPKEMDSDINSFTPEDFIFESIKTNEVRLKGLLPTGAYKVTKNGGKVVLPNYDGEGSVVKEIGDYAFYRIGLTGVDFSQCTNLQRIGYSAFSIDQLTSLNLSGCTNLQSIGDYAFSGDKLTSLDLSGCTNLQSIGEGAFYNNQLTSADIPLSLSSLNRNAFLDNKARPLPLYTSDFTNPNNLKDSYWHIINPVNIALKYVDEEGNEIKAQDEYIVSSSGKNVILPRIPGFTRESYSMKLTPTEPRKRQEVQKIVYKKITDDDLNNKISLTMSNYIDSKTGQTINKYHIGYEEGTVNLNLKVIDALNPDTEKYAKPILRVYFDKNYVDSNSIRIPGSSNISSITKGQDYVDINLRELNSATNMIVPILFKLKQYSTPSNKDLFFQTELYDGDKVLQRSNKVPVEGYYLKPDLTITTPQNVNTTNPDSADGPRLGGKVELLKIGDNLVTRINPAQDVPYSFIVGNLVRNVDAFTLTTHIPTYEMMADDGSVTTERAVFDQAKNKDWKLAEDGVTLTYTGNAMNSRNIEIPKLIFSFPKAVEHSGIDLKADIQMTPNDQAPKEPLLEAKDPIRISFTGPLVITPPPGVRTAGKVIMSGRYNNGERYIFDTPEDRKQMVNWDIYYSSLAKERVQNLMIIDRELDKRLQYEGLDFKGFKTKVPATLKFYKIVGDARNPEKDTVLEEAKIILGQDLYYKVNNPTADYFTLTTDPGYDVDRTAILRLATSVRNPENNLLKTEEKDSMPNTADINYDYFPEDGGKGRSETIAKSRLVVYPNKPERKIYIKWHEKHQNTAHLAGEDEDITVKWIDSNFGVPVDGALSDKPIKDVRVVVLLPKNLTIKDIKPTDAFLSSKEAKYEYVPNYKDGQAAIVMTAAEMDTKIKDLLSIKAKLDYDMAEGEHTAEAYGKWTHDTVKALNTKQFEGETYTYDTDTVKLITVKELVTTIYISDDKDNVSRKDGIKTEVAAPFHYTIKTVNNSEKERKNLSVTALYPFIGDTEINTSEKRNSEFSNKQIGEARVYMDGRDVTDQYIVEYTTSKDLKTASWSSSYSPDTMATRIRAKDDTVTLPVGSVLTLSIPMKAKELNPITDASQILEDAGKKAYISAVRSDDSTGGRELETNRVYNEIVEPKGEVTFVKHGLKKSWFSNTYKPIPLEGAVFNVLDENGSFIAKAVSDSKGRVTFTDIPVKNVRIVEVQAPKGYELSGKEVTLSKEDFKYVDGKFVAKIDGMPFVNNYPLFGDLTIKKLSKKQTPLSGIKFEVKGISSFNKDYVKVIETDRDGLAILKNIPEGQYRITEITQDDSKAYFVPAPYQDFEIRHTTGDTPAYNGQNIIIEKTFVNDTLRVPLSKLGFKTLPDKDLNDMPSWNVPKYSGYEFKIKNLTSGEEQTKMTGDKGVVWVDLKTDTSYEITEIANPSKIHKQNTKTYTVYVSDDGKLFLGDKTTPILSENIYIPNEEKKIDGRVVINKKDGEGKPLKGVEFTLYKDNLLFDTEIKKEVTQDDGLAVFEGLEPGKYVVKETKTLNGYLLNDKEMKFTIEDTAGSFMETKTSGDDYYDIQSEKITHVFKFEMINYKISLDIFKGEVILRNAKTEENYPNDRYYTLRDGEYVTVAKRLKDAEFDLYEDNQKVLSVKSLEDGKIDFKNYAFDPNKEYKLIETKAPVDPDTGTEYKLDPTPMIINIKEEAKKQGFNGHIFRIFENKPLTGKIIISKYDLNTKKVLSGVEFTLYNEAREVKDKLVTNDIGLITWQNLPFGTYYVKETKVANDNYMLDETEIKITLTKEDSISQITRYNHYKEKAVHILKVNSQSEALKGAIFAIYASQEDAKNQTNELQRMTSGDDGRISFVKLKDQEKYYIREVKAPEGYRYSDEIIETEGTYDQNFNNDTAIKVTNYTRYELPRTGKRLIFISGVTGVVLLVLGLALTKKKEQGRA